MASGPVPGLLPASYRPPTGLLPASYRSPTGQLSSLLPFQPARNDQSPTPATTVLTSWREKRRGSTGKRRGTPGNAGERRRTPGNAAERRGTPGNARVRTASTAFTIIIRRVSPFLCYFSFFLISFLFWLPRES